MSRLYNILDALVNRTGISSTSVSSTYGTLWLFKDNSTNTVRAYGYARSGSNINLDTALFTVPSGYRPSSLATIPMTIAVDSGAIAAYYGYVFTNGEVKQHLSGYAREISIFAEWKV